MKWTTLLLAAVLLSGCATTAKYEKALNSWLGSSELELVRQWGPPQQAYEAGGSKFLVYSNSGTVYIPGQAPSYQTNYYGNTAYTTPYGGVPAQNIAVSCETTFEVVDDVITNWTWRGNNCVAE